ncbi:MAG: glutathione S-transferase C-terminal domain-containing protein, partial [Planctomycetota bacterium]
PATPELEKAMNALVHCCDGDFKHHLDRYKYANRYAGVCAQEHRSAASAFLLHLEERLQTNTFLLQDKPCLADMALAPFVRQFAFADRNWFDTQPWPHLRAWLDAFIASPRFLSIMEKHSPWVADAAPIKIDWL